MEAMKPCPFCGGEPYLERNHRNFVKGEPTRVALVRCTQCEAKSGKFDLRIYDPTTAKTLAIEAWNRRADEPSGWIRCEERSPEPLEKVWLFSSRYQSMLIGMRGLQNPNHVFVDDGIDLQLSDISHWMPKPDPPVDWRTEE